MKLDQEDIDAIVEAVSKRASKEIRKFVWWMIGIFLFVRLCEYLWSNLGP